MQISSPALNFWTPLNPRGNESCDADENEFLLPCQNCLNTWKKVFRNIKRQKGETNVLIKNKPTNLNQLSIPYQSP